MLQDIRIQTIVGDGEEIIIDKRPKRVRGIPMFMPLGLIVLEPGTGKKQDTCEVLTNLSKPARRLWWEFVGNRVRHTNMVVHRVTAQIEKNQTTKAYKELFAIGLIKRVKPQNYMINPDVIIPIKQYHEVKENWEAI